VVSYGSSPPFEVLFSEELIDTPPTGVLTAEGACFRQIEFVGILKGTEQRELAEAWVDFMLSTTFQEDLPLQMFVFPVNPNAELDPVFEQFLFLPENPVALDPAEIAEKREEWISAWRDVVLQ
jgi:thiamine transport system substrate-binding protein